MDQTTDYISEQDQQDAAQAQAEEALAKIEAVGRALSAKRTDAINSRESSGVERDWVEDEEAYQGIDDANRSDRNAIPRSPSGGSLIMDVPKDTTRSRVFLNITRPYVDAAAAKVADMLLPTDDRNWAIQPTPIPDLQRAKDDQTPLVNPMGQPVMMPMPAVDGQPTPAGPDGQPLQKQVTVADQVAKIMQDARKKATAAERRIDDWLVECQYHAEVRKVIEDCARLGTGILKGPFAARHIKKEFKNEAGETSLKMASTIYPKSKRIDPWNLFPDPACGENIHNGSYIWEKDSITAKQLRELRDTKGYVASQVELVLEEGPGKKWVSNKDKDTTGDKELYEVWYYHGTLDVEDMRAAGVEIEEKDVVSAMVVMVNDRVIKAAVNPLDSGEFPYDVMAWQRRTDHWAGVGVGRQARTPQRMLNGAVRNLMDNAGLSAGPQLVFRDGILVPQNGKWEITPRKMWKVTEDADIRSVGDALAAINIPTMQVELMGIIQFAQKMAEDTTGLPMLLQGQQGSAPETVGGMTMLSNNANSVLRRIARTFDDYVTEPHIRRYYEWLMMYGTDPSEKGDFTIDARGSTALVERDMQNQWLLQAAGLAVPGNPYKIDPAKYFEELAKSQKFDPARLQYSEEDWAKVQQAMQQQQQQDPNVVRAQATLQAAQIRSQTEQQNAVADQKLSEMEMNLRMQDAQAERLHQKEMAMLARDTEMMKLASSQRMSIDKIRAQLADTSVKERNKRDMFTAEANLKTTQGSGI